MYIVIEIQTTHENANTIANTYSESSQAESKYYQILAYAAVSNVYKHGAVLLMDDGTLIKTECFTHEENQE